MDIQGEVGILEKQETPKIPPRSPIKYEIKCSIKKNQRYLNSVCRLMMEKYVIPNNLENIYKIILELIFEKIEIETIESSTNMKIVHFIIPINNSVFDACSEISIEVLKKMVCEVYQLINLEIKIKETLQDDYDTREPWYYKISCIDVSYQSKN